MHDTLVQSLDAMAGASVVGADMKLEVVTLPVIDVERSKAFYASLGWRLDADFSEGEARLVQFTPPGSGCSIQFGERLTPAAPGSVQNLFLIVPDVQVARDTLVGRGVDVSEVFHHTGGPSRFGERVSGPAPHHRSYGSYASFSDPDGNGWLLQEVTTRLPRRLQPGATFASSSDLAGALRRAFAAHEQHEKRTGQRDANWPEWYAAYLVAEQTGGPSLS